MNIFNILKCDVLYVVFKTNYMPANQHLYYFAHLNISLL